MEVFEGIERVRVYQPVSYRRSSRNCRHAVEYVDDCYESVYADYWGRKSRDELGIRLGRMDDLRWRRLLKGIELGLRSIGVDDDLLSEMLYSVKSGFCSCVVIDLGSDIVGIDYMGEFYRFVEPINTD